MGRERISVRALKEYVDTKYTNSAMANGSAILDDSSNQLIKFTKVGSAINEVNVSNNSTGNAPVIAVTGDDTNIGLVINQKAAAPITLGTTACTGVKLGVDQPILDSAGLELLKFTKAATAVNEITIANAATGNAPSISATGETNVDLTLAAKGTGHINAPALNPTFGVSAHDYAAGAVAWTLSAAEMQDIIVTASNASGAVDAIATPTAGKVYIVSNATGYALTFKATGQTGVAVANNKTAIVRGNGTDFVRVTADA